MKFLTTMSRTTALAALMIFATAATVSAEQGADDEAQEEGILLATNSPDWEEAEDDWGEVEETQTTRRRRQREESYPDRPEPPEYFATISFSPLHLFYPMLLGMGEYRLTEDVGIAGIGGIGYLSENHFIHTDEDLRYSALMLQVGSQINFYPMRDFAGLHIGAQGSLAHVRMEFDGATGTGTGVGVHGYGGYKGVSSFGLTFVGQLGVGYTVATATATDGTMAASATDSGFGFLLTLNLGWTL